MAKSGMAKKEKLEGVEKFNQFFKEIYQTRWEKLSQSLKTKEKQVARLSFPENSVNDIPYLKNCLWYDKENINPNELKEDGLKKFYIMDPASAIVANALEVKSGDSVLDMCAAPGGKTLILSEKIGDEGSLICNELSSSRRDRLKKVLREYVPEKRRMQISIKGIDASRFGIVSPETYDKILLDAPCSGEKHLVTSPQELSKWTVKRTKRLAGLQYSMLCSALLSLKSKGQIVYSTCSISPLENDEVIEKLLLKKGSEFELDLPNEVSEMAEKTKYGYLHLPDKCGFGPLYFSRLRKK